MRKNAVLVLTHLVLNDMMKVKGHIAGLAVCLRDACPRIADLARLFFHELAARAHKVQLNLGPRPSSASGTALHVHVTTAMRC